MSIRYLAIVRSGAIDRLEGKLAGVRLLLACLLSTWALLGTAAPPPPGTELVIRGGRVIDPETGLDAIRDVAVGGGAILAIATDFDALPAGVELLDAEGLALAPGFIDLHVHGQSEAAHEYQARDGVTTALELEWGYPEVGAFLDSRRGASRIHYGASVSHGVVRALAAIEDDAERDALRARLAAAVAEDEPLRTLQGLVGRTFYEPLDVSAETRLAAEFARQVDAGALGIGMAHAYYPGADGAEILGVFEAAAALGVPIATHVRGRGLPAVQEVVANAAATGAALHVVHVNSSSLGEIEAVLRLVEGARARGVDVSTEAYPYTAGSTSIQAALFDGDWRSDYGIDYGDVQWQDTGERLTAETFARYREQGGVVILHMMREEWVQQALGNDWVIVASDGMPYAPGAHPRTAGTFARVLGRYVREQGLLDLPTAIAKMTLLPARRLEPIAPAMAKKGRVQVGADADLVLFDPARVIDTATFESGPRFSDGIEWVFVKGVAVVAEGETVAGVHPGEPIIGRRGTAAAPARSDDRQRPHEDRT